MNFKDLIAKDLAIFINPDEFATVANINGSAVPVVVDDELLTKQNLQKGEGLARGELLFIVKKEDLPEKPFVDKRMRFNGQSYKIVELISGDDIYTITLAGMRS